MARTSRGFEVTAAPRGHVVTLLTSHPEAVDGLREGPAPDEHWSLQRFRTFDDLHERMQALLSPGGFDVLVHCAAVSDYRAAGVYAPADGTSFDEKSNRAYSPSKLVDRITNATPSAAAHGRTPNSRVIP